MLLLISTLEATLEALSYPCSCCLCCRIPHSLVTEYVCGELRLCLGQTGPCSAVVGMDLGQHEEVSNGGDTESNSNTHDKETDKDGATSGFLALEGGDGRNDTTATRSRDAESHDTREDELAEEHKEKEHKVETRVVAEGLVGRPEPAEEGERDEDEAVDQGETKLRAFVLSREEVAQASEYVADHQQ